MKKTVLFSAAVLLIFALSACQGDILTKMELSAALDIRVSGGTVETDVDSHGGFHGDGTRYVSMHFSKDPVAEKGSEDGWKPLPLAENLNALVYGVSEGDSQIGPYLTDDEGAGLFPSVRNGYYFFEDRHAERTDKDKYDGVGVLERNSFNFTLALYDTDTGTLYYVKFDT